MIAHARKVVDGWINTVHKVYGTAVNYEYVRWWKAQKIKIPIKKITGRAAQICSRFMNHN